MGRVYATEEQTGRLVLVRIECDHPGCCNETRPSEIGDWMQLGKYRCPGAEENKVRLFYCPIHTFDFITSFVGGKNPPLPPPESTP